MGGLRTLKAVEPRWTVLVLVSVLLAGCADTGGGSKLNAPGAPATFDATTGAVEGDILDDENVPVGGARVAILAVGIESTSDENGHFSLSNVPPGTHVLTVLALGYTEKEQEITVNVGEITPVQVALSLMGTIEPYSVLQIKRGLFGCGSSWRPAIGVPGVIGVSGIAVCGVLGIADEFTGTNTTAYDRFLILWEVPNSTNGGWNASVFEMAWDSNQFAGKGLTMIWEVDGCSNVRSHTFARKDGRSPLWATANGTVINRVLTAAQKDDCDEEAKKRCNPLECTMHSRVFSAPDTFGGGSPADIGVTFQQPFEQLHTSFYHEPPMPEYSALR